jgi:hypothetical protein
MRRRFPRSAPGIVAALVPGALVVAVLVVAVPARGTSPDPFPLDATATRWIVREYHVGGFHVFGASTPVPSLLLNPARRCF